MHGGNIEAFYFGPSGKALFGCHHAPVSGPARDHGVVLCYPMGQEFIRAHRAFRQLALRLSRVGFHVLRFDYYGSGDSAGDSSEGDTRQWISDIATAVDEVKHSLGISKVSMVGLRLGASLSLLAGARRSDVKSTVLWEPVVNGKDYVHELTALHHHWLLGVKSISKQLGKNNTDFEVLGFPMTDVLRSDLEEIDLLGIQKPPADNILILQSEKKASSLQLGEHLGKLGVNYTYHHLPEQRVWLKGKEMFKSLVPNQTLQRIVQWVTEVGS